MESILKWTYDIFSAFTCYTDAHIKNAYSFKKKLGQRIYMYSLWAKTFGFWQLEHLVIISGTQLWLWAQQSHPPALSESESLLTILELST